jgi:inward rectifier potassium channel
MRTSHFFATILAFYCSLNILFATVYFLIGVENLAGTEHTITEGGKFWEAFFFSSQTLTTLGYGRVAPVGVVANTVAFFEALIGILSFAIVTGLMYGRFARPKAYLIFSHNAVIAPYEGGTALMFRLASYKNNLLTDLDATVTVAMRDLPANNSTPGILGVVQFYPVGLEIAHIGNLALNWTVVHPINDASPLAGLTAEDYSTRHVEVIVSIRGFDDHFATTVQQRTSYAGDEIVYGARFQPMFHRSEDGFATVLELDKINSFSRVELPAKAPVVETVEQVTG